MMPLAELERRLDDLIADGLDLVARPIAGDSDLDEARDDHAQWRDRNVWLLRRAVSTSEPADEFSALAPGAPFQAEPSFANLVEGFHSDVRRDISWLSNAQRRLDRYQPGTGRRPGAAADANRQSVFIVHGRSDAPREAVARFLSQVTSLRPIILREQPNSGRTIIEKFEQYAATAAFAVVLLTGDDEGGLRGSGRRSRRARQNVVFELGFFIAKLGRPRVAVLYEAGVELPSDMSGILWTPLDGPGGDWRMELARELQAVEVDVDLNRAI